MKSSKAPGVKADRRDCEPVMMLAFANDDNNESEDGDANKV